MTEEQAKAYEYLERYHQATIKASGQERLLAALKARIEKEKEA